MRRLATRRLTATFALEGIMVGSGRLACFMLLWVGLAAAAEPLTPIDPDAHYPEGPLWREGKLFYVEYSPGTIKYWDGARTGLYWHKEGCGPSATQASSVATPSARSRSISVCGRSVGSACDMPASVGDSLGLPSRT